MRITQGDWKGRCLKMPRSNVTRPTADRLRGTIFNSLYSLLKRQNRHLNEMKVLDLFAGSGALGFEALSRGARHVTFIDQNPEAYGCIRYNAQALQAQDRCLIRRADVMDLTRPVIPYDLVLIDAPYNKGLSQRALYKLEKTASCAPRGIVIIETSALETILPLSSYWSLYSHRRSGSAGLWILEQQTIQDV